MYLFDPEHEDLPANRDADLFLEKQLTRTKGLVYKYPGRAIVLLSYTCAANCRYCERQDRVGVGLDSEGRLQPEEIDAAVSFVAESPEITEVIFSGGDPLTHPVGLDRAWRAMAALPQVAILRIHTRFPLQAPDKVDFDLLEGLAGCDAMPYLSLHIDHPDELTPETEAAIGRLRRMGYVLISQSVFLKGVNDDLDVLDRMFTRLAQLGVCPYYLYHCHPIATTMRFVMTLDEEIELMSRLRERISGVACPQHIFEMRGTTGKLVVPTDHWSVDLTSVCDFTGATQDVRSVAMDVELPTVSLSAPAKTGAQAADGMPDG
ncbi:L-lysine 2,3-aminomutase [Posidoniimonas corsicana]|uniref:L-lysine 2,3-aminomutase n=2 Tax=Posidoniimonas corsicana TaxID=1938618 RepID=A0A5C5UTE9_9BACT|nr:L-lysine 2,3-aminomutase [Posidoniimonas corsicana]